MNSINSNTHHARRDRDLSDTGIVPKISKECPTLSPPSRPDLTAMTYRRHLDEVKSIITFLGSLTSYDVVAQDINEHLNSLL